MKQVEICWTQDVANRRQKGAVFWTEGNAYGYSSHSNQLKRSLSYTPGVRITDDAPVAIHLCTADRFVSLPGKRNFLYSMYEMEELPEPFVRRLHEPDGIIVPCWHNKRLFEKYTDTPVYVCWEGVNPEKHPFEERVMPKIKPFRFLWFGAPNPRKGFISLSGAWDLFLRHMKSLPPSVAGPVELYIKTTVSRRIDRFPRNVIFDSRNLPRDQLHRVYADAHAFIFPTMGEGFGLTLAEAMCTGLPCASTYYSGCADFLNQKNGYPMDFEWYRVTGHAFKHSADCAWVHPKTGAKAMWEMYRNYGRALEKGRIAADLIRRKFTWDLSAERLVEILTEGDGPIYKRREGAALFDYLGKANRKHRDRRSRMASKVA